MLYITKVDDHTLITHDGYIQLGYYNMSLKEFFEKTKVKYLETHWIPDTFTNRYRRVNYQKHLECASIGTKEND